MPAQLLYDLIALGDGQYAHVSTADYWVDSTMGEIAQRVIYTDAICTVRVSVVRDNPVSVRDCVRCAMDYLQVLSAVGALN